MRMKKSTSTKRDTEKPEKKMEQGLLDLSLQEKRAIVQTVSDPARSFFFRSDLLLPAVIGLCALLWCGLASSKAVVELVWNGRSCY